MIGLRRMMLSDKRWASITLSALFSASCIYAGLCTEEEPEFVVLARNSMDLVGFKGTLKPVYQYNTDVDLLPWQRLHHFGIPSIQGSQIPSGNSDIGLGLLHLLSLLGLLGLGWGLAWFATKTDPASRAWEEAKPEALPFHLCTYGFALCHIKLERGFDVGAALPGLHLSLRCIASDNGLSPVMLQVITWTNVDIVYWNKNQWNLNWKNTIFIWGSLV